jgi:hypothetical protein
VRRLFSSCATKLAVLLASSSACERGSASMAGCFFLGAPERRVDFFRLESPRFAKLDRPES